MRKKYLLIIIFIGLLALPIHASEFPLINKIEGLSNPCGMAVDAGGNIYIANTGANEIRKYNPSGTAYLQTIGGSAGLRNPEGVAVAPDGSIYVADTGNNRVIKFDSNGTKKWEISGGARRSWRTDWWWDALVTAYLGANEGIDEISNFNLPRDIVVVSDGGFFVVDSANHQVVKFNSNGTPNFFVDEGVESGRAGNLNVNKWETRRRNNFIRLEGSYNNPYSLSIDGNNNVYAVDTYNRRIQKFDRNGKRVMVAGSYSWLSLPEGIAVGKEGNIFLADTMFHKIVKFDSGGALLKSFGSMGIEDSNLFSPRKIVARQNGNQELLYVVDSNSNRLQIFDVTDLIESVSASDTYVSPNGDGVKDSVEISFVLTKPAGVMAGIYDSKAQPVRTLLNGESKGAGKSSVVWDGRTNGGNVAPDGIYTYQVSGVLAGYTSPPMTGNIYLDTTPPEMHISASPKAISPNGDGVSDRMTLSTEIMDQLSSTVKEVKLNIYQKKSDGEYQLISLLMDKPSSPVPYSEVSIWEGSFGPYVVEGCYRLELRATDLAGNTAALNDEVFVDFQPPRIEAVNVSNPYFSPNGDGRKDNTEISFNLYDTYARKMYVTVLVEDRDGKEAATIARRVELSPGEQKFIWDGRGNGPIADGQYFIKIYAEDEAGNLGRSGPAVVVVDTVPPTIESVAVNPNPFTPNNDGVKDWTLFSYSLSEPCYTELKIFRNDGTTLFRDYRQYNIINGSYKWDGSGFHGEILGEEHPYYLYAEDRAGNVTTSDSQIIVVDHAPSLVPFAFAEPDPFSPVNPKNNFTDIKYYLSRDGLSVEVAVIGRDARVVKRLLNNEVQTKGDHSVRWYGDFDSGYDGPRASKDSTKVADGSWEFKVVASASDEPKPADTSNTVLVDNVPPMISIARVETDLVSRCATVKYSIPEKASVEVAVFDGGNNLLAEIENGAVKDPGAYATTWRAAAGINDWAYFKISAVDKALNQAEKKTELFSVVPTGNFQITDQAASPNPFTPNGDGHSDLTRIFYRISGGAPDYRVSINILNSIGATIKRLAEDEIQSPGSYSLYWDGKTDGNQLAGDGYYDYQIIAEDKLGTKIEGRGTILAVSTRPAVDLSTNFPIFSPNGDNSKDTVTFNYSINYPIFYITGESLVKIEVINASGEAVWSKVFNHTAGSYVYEYDGLAANNLPLTTGNYYVKISAEDALGSTAVPKTIPLQVDYAEPMVVIQSISPDLFSPYPNGNKDQAVISYTLAKPAYVTVKVKQGETTIKTLQADLWTEAYIPTTGLSAKKVKAFGIPTIIWDGKDEAGNYVADGDYTIEISSLDPAGNSHSTTQTVEVDNTLPVVPIVDLPPANTNEAVLVVAGTAEPNSNVEIYDNDNLLGSGNTGADGRFNLMVSLYGGLNNLKARSEDGAGNVTDYSVVQQVIYETDAPIISNVTVTPNPAKAGLITVTFNVSETLESDPVVKVNGNQASKETGTENSFSGSWRYTYSYNVTSSDLQGSATISIEATDLAHNSTLYQSSSLLTVDTINTTVSNVDINVEGNPRGTGSTAYAKLGSKVTIDFTVDETQLVDPIVTVGGLTATKESKTIYSTNRIDYSYSLSLIPSFLPDGTTPVSIEVTDLAGNIIRNSYNALTVDKASAEIGAISVSRNPANEGPLDIRFTVIDATSGLNNNPTVEVTQASGGTQTYQAAKVSGDTYGITYDIPADNSRDGIALITVKATDKAKNYSSASQTFEVDTKDPTFGSVSSLVLNNPDFSQYAKEGATVIISLEASEALKSNPAPVLKVNDNTASLVSNDDKKYTFEYQISSSDTNGQAALLVYGYDLANNYGEYSTSKPSESFVIDRERPTVIISSDPDMIAEPSPFSTNASSEAGHRQTRLRYEISEYGYVTVSIHKVPNTQEVYSRSDFKDNNRVASFSEGWLEAGEHFRYWNGAIQNNQAIYDKNSNGFADPGKYAFIVEVTDRAGNVIEGKWGGTCWIQDNVLDLVQADRTEAGGDNPRPRYFSPNNDGISESTTVWFRVRLGVSPEEPWRPEKIGVLTIPDDFKWVAGKKLIGSYTVRVWNESKTTLIRTMVRDTPLDSNVVLYETWNGKNDAGQYVPEGNYKIEIDARDFIGGAAENNLLTLTVTVDKNPPRIVSNEPNLSGTAWRNSSKTYDVNFYDDHNAYASKLKHAQYKVTTAPNQNGTVIVDWRDIFADGLNASSYTTDWGSEIFNLCGEGTYYVSVKANDYAGNEKIQNDVFYLKKDVGAPTSGKISINGIDTYTNTTGVTIKFEANDNLSGCSKVKLSNDNINWSAEMNYEDQKWTLPDSEGQKWVYAKIRDAAGNWTAYEIKDDITLDKSAPAVGSLTVSKNPFNQMYESTTVEFDISDTYSGSIYYEALIYTVGGVKVKTLHTFNDNLTTKGTKQCIWNGQNDNNDYVNEGDYIFKIKVKDQAGNESDWVTGPIIQARDDIRITNNSADSNSPYLTISGNILTLKWMEVFNEQNRKVEIIDIPSEITLEKIGQDFYIDRPQTVTMQTVVKKIGYALFEIRKKDSGAKVWDRWYSGYWESGVRTDEASLDPGWYYSYAKAQAYYKQVGYASMEFKYNQYTRTSSDWGETWQNEGSWPEKVDICQTGPSIVNNGNVRHWVMIEGGQLWYRRVWKYGQYTSISNWIKLTNTASNKANPSLTSDYNNNAYVAWEDDRDGNSEIYFQKIPYDFAPINGTPTAVLAITPEHLTLTQSATLETPTLLAPKDKSENVQTLRPTFEWKHRRGDTTEYKLDFAKNNDFSIAHQSFTKSANTGSPDKTDSNLYYYNYSIHEFDPGLERNTDYFWKVTALSTSEAATSEVWSFKIQPDLSLTGITNYPNPINPNHSDPNQRKTKIRYRLSTDASEVKIRIYDITGSLVTELDGTTNGEGSSIWNKYNDVEWDGRNGRGDMVVNGIYPFEIIARSGDKSVSGRGKIAVLK